MKLKQAFADTPNADLTTAKYRKKAVLSDGGVYDNLGMETAYKNYLCLLVSDGGQKIEPDPDPAWDWAQHSIRVLGVIDNQVRSLRKRQLIDSYNVYNAADAYGGIARSGTYWSTLSKFADYKLADDPLGCTVRDPAPIAATPTRLQAMPAALQKKLVNWGYAICDTALRKHFGAKVQAEFGVTISMPKGFPFTGGY